MRKNNNSVKNFTSKNFQGKKDNIINNQININKQTKLKDNKDMNNNLVNDSQNNLEFVNNSDFIKDLISFSKKRKAKKKIGNKDNSNKDLNNNTYKGNYIKKNNIEMNYEISSNNNHSYVHLLTEKNKKNVKLGKTEKNSPIKNILANKEQGLEKNSTLSEFFTSNKKKYQKIIKNKSILNINVNEVIENPFLQNIKEPKEGHSKGIIQLIKNSKITPDNKYIFDNEPGREKENNKTKNLKDNNVFDKHKINKVYNEKNNYSYKKKLFQNDSINKNENNKNVKFNSEIKNIFYNHNKLLSYNKFNNNSPSFHTQNKLFFKNTSEKIEDKYQYKNKNKEENLSSNKDNLNNIKNKHLYKKLNTNQLFNISKSPMVNNQNNLQNNIVVKKRIRKQKKDLNLYKDTYNNKSDNKVNSPILFNKVIDLRNKYLNDNHSYDEDNINIDFNLTKYNNDSYLPKDKYDYLENNILLKSSFSKDKFENTNKKTNNNFYNNNLTNLKESQTDSKLFRTQTQFSLFNKLTRKKIKDKNQLNMNKTNVSSKENINILYLNQKNYRMNKYKPYKRNKIKNNFNMNSNNSSNKRILQNNDSINGSGFLFSKPLNYISPPKSPSQIYKKPLYKNNLLEISKPTNTINNNFIIYRDEINFINKEKEFNIDEENINLDLYKNKENFSINQKISNKNHNFFSKYYLYHLKRPKIKINYFTHQNIEKLVKQKGTKPIKIITSPICEFTKLSLIKFKKDKNNSINKINLNVGKRAYYKNIKSKRNINVIQKNKTEQKPIKFQRVIGIKNKAILPHKLEAYKMDEFKNQMKKNNNINNDIIFLLNIITFKNVLNVENQLMKLIIKYNNTLNIQNNEENAKLFINEIINNINIFMKILINKVINEKKFIELYSKLCNDLCKKYLYSINDLIINKFLKKSNDNMNEYNIINNFKKILNNECLKQFENLLLSNFKEEIKQKIIYLLNFLHLTLENDITNIETLTNIMNNIFNEYEKAEFIEYKHYLLYLNIYLILKINKKNNLVSIKNFVDKIHFIIQKELNEDKLPKYLKLKIQQFKKSYDVKSEIEIKDENDFSCLELIKLDIENYINYIKELKKAKEGIMESKYEKQYDFKILNFIKKWELEEIIRNYINISINSIMKEEDIIFYKNYIKIIIEQISNKLSLSKLRIFHNKMLLILSDINQICSKNIYVFEIFGYLIYLLIKNELCDVEDMNIFINKDEESKINICKTIKFIILSSEDIKNYYDDFKRIELFNNNSLFNDYIEKKINKII